MMMMMMKMMVMMIMIMTVMVMITMMTMAMRMNMMMWMMMTVMLMMAMMAMMIMPMLLMLTMKLLSRASAKEEMTAALALEQDLDSPKKKNKLSALAGSLSQGTLLPRMVWSFATAFAETLGLPLTGDLYPCGAADLLRDADPLPDDNGEGEYKLFSDGLSFLVEVLRCIFLILCTELGVAEGSAMPALPAFA